MTLRKLNVLWKMHLKLKQPPQKKSITIKKNRRSQTKTVDTNLNQKVFIDELGI